MGSNENSLSTKRIGEFFISRVWFKCDRRCRQWILSDFINAHKYSIIIENDYSHRNLVSDSCFNLHSTEPEGTVTQNSNNVFVRTTNLCSNTEWDSDAHGTE